jgi:hypothetical protein
VNVCPDCEVPLPQTARSCRCGWVLPAILPQIQTREDVLAEREAEHLARAREYMRAYGLEERRPDETADEYGRRMMKWLKENVLKIGRAA